MRISPGLVFVVILLLIFMAILFFLDKEVGKQQKTQQELIDSLRQENFNLQQKMDSLKLDLRERAVEAIQNCRALWATSYNSLEDQCWGDPYETASQTHVSFKTLALSQDMITRWHKYRPEGKYCYGDTVWVLFLKAFIVEDTMHEKYSLRADIWNDDYQESVAFGVQKVFLIRP